VAGRERVGVDVAHRNGQPIVETSGGDALAGDGGHDRQLEHGRRQVGVPPSCSDGPRAGAASDIEQALVSLEIVTGSKRVGRTGEDSLDPGTSVELTMATHDAALATGA
jgi:hypothetical protein